MFIKQVNDESACLLNFDLFDVLWYLSFFPICLSYVAGGCSVLEIGFINLLQGIL